MSDLPNFCTRCGRELHPNKVRWLELDQRINRYHDFNDVPADQSQGWFAFGPDCASAERVKAIKARNNA